MLQDNISLPTDNFYKFLAIFGLLIVICCTLFNPYFLEPSNKEITDNNLMNAEYCSQIGYLRSKIINYENEIPDSLKQNAILTFFKYKNNISDTISFLLNPINKKYLQQVNEINELNYQYSKAKFKSMFIESYLEAKQSNYNINSIFIIIIGALGLIISLFGFNHWYKYQLLLNKKLEIEIVKLKKDNN